MPSSMEQLLLLLTFRGRGVQEALLVHWLDGTDTSIYTDTLWINKLWRIWWTANL